MIIQYLQPRSRWRGFSFALHPDPVQGFYFAQMQYGLMQAFTTCFAVSMQLYRPHRKTAHMALQRCFLRLHPLNSPQYQTGTSGYNTTCDTLEGIHAPGRVQPIPDTTATPNAAQVSTAAYYNKVYKRVQRCAPVIDPYQTVQHIADHAIPAGSRCFPRPAACTLAPGQQSGAGGAVQQQGRGGRRGTIGDSRRISFRAVAR